MSFAHRPEAFTDSWIKQLEAGVSRQQLLEFFDRAGLPMSTAAHMIAPNLGDGSSADLAWGDRSRGYRRGVVGLLLAFVTPAVAFALFDSDASVGRTVALSFSFAITGWLVYRLIVRLSSAGRP